MFGKEKAKATDQDGKPVEADVVDENGNVIKPKKTWKERLILVGKVAAGVGLALGGCAVGYVTGSKKVTKEKDRKIQELMDTNTQLFKDNIDLYDQLHPEDTEKVETEDEVE